MAETKISITDSTNPVLLIIRTLLIDKGMQVTKESK
jgi:hypothetical protein